MPFSVDKIGRLFIIRWSDLDIPELGRAIEQIRAAHAEVGKLLYVTIVAPYARIPNRSERQALNRFSGEAHEMCEVAYLVFQGDTLRHKLQRTAMTGVRLFMLQRKVPTTIHKDVAEIFSDLAQRMGRSVDDVRALFAARDIA